MVGKARAKAAIPKSSGVKSLVRIGRHRKYKP